MAITSMTDLLAALPGQQIVGFKSTPNTTVGLFSALWQSAGYPFAGAAPSSGLSGDVPTNATLGAIPFVNPASGGSYPARFTASASSGQGGWIAIYDRLWQNSGISATSTTAQTVSSTALTRPDANGANVEAWWQVYGVMGAATPTITLTYTNQSGTGSKTGSSGVLATTMAAAQTGPFTLASGDTGVRSIQTWQADTSFISGTIGLVLRRPILAFPVITAVSPILTALVADAIAAAMASIPNNACLEVIFLPATSQATSLITFALNIVQG